MYGFFNHFGERFQKDAVLVSGFTGFVWTERRFVKRKIHADSCGSGLKQCVFCWFKIMKEKTCAVRYVVVKEVAGSAP